MSGVTLICQKVPVKDLRDHNGWVLQKIKNRKGETIWGRIAEHVDSPHDPKSEPGWVWVLVYSDTKIGYPIWHELQTFRALKVLETEICFKFDENNQKEDNHEG